MTQTPDSKPKSISPKVLALSAITLVFIWGSAFTLIDVGVAHIAPIWLVAYRLSIGCLLVTLYALFRGQRFPKIRDSRWIWYLCLGITSSVLPFFLVTTGQLKVDSGLSAILIGFMPIMTIILAHFFTDEKLNTLKLLGFSVGLFGIILLFMPDDFSFELVKDWKSQLMIIMAAFCYAITTVGAKRAPDTPPSIAAAMMLVMAALIAVIAALFSGLPESIPPTPSLLAAIGLGIGSTGIATILYLYVLQLTGPSLIAKVNYFVPAVSVSLGVIFLNEPLTLRIIISFGIIILGIIIARRGVDKPITPIIR